jgi:hypothetical protein
VDPIYLTGYTARPDSYDLPNVLRVHTAEGVHQEDPLRAVPLVSVETSYKINGHSQDPVHLSRKDALAAAVALVRAALAGEELLRGTQGPRDEDEIALLHSSLGELDGWSSRLRAELNITNDQNDEE